MRAGENGYDIAIATDENFVIATMVALAGIAAFSDKDKEIRFHVFTEKVEKKSFELLCERLITIHPNSKISRYECDEQLLSNLPYWAGSRMSAVRYWFPRLLPEVDWCLYVDCDVLYLLDVQEHFDLADESKYAVVVQDPMKELREHDCRWIKDHCGVTVDSEKYFNAGVALFNFKKMREDDIPEKLRNFYRDHSDAPMVDQTAMNTIFHGENLVWVSDKFNNLQLFLTAEKLHTRCVIHFAGGKPWHNGMGQVANSRFYLWHSFADKYLWQKNGESCRRCFSWRMLMAKKVLFAVLRLPFVGHGLAWLMGKVRLVKGDGCSWRRMQIIPRLETREVKMFMRSLVGEFR